MKFQAIATPDQAGFEQWVAKVKQAPNTLTTMDEFEKLAAPSENHPVEYFSNANPELFKQVIEKFKMSHGKMDMSGHEGMDMSEASHAGAEE